MLSEAVESISDGDSLGPCDTCRVLPGLGLPYEYDGGPAMGIAGWSVAPSRGRRVARAARLFSPAGVNITLSDAYKSSLIDQTCILALDVGKAASAGVVRVFTQEIE